MALPKTAPPPSGKLPPLPPPVASTKPRASNKQTKPNKTFHIATWSGASEGEKILGYADSGMGKTTLAIMVPTPVFHGLDDGGRKLRDTKTGEEMELKHIPGVETFDDFRQSIQQVDLYDDYETVVVDTGTALEPLALDWVLQNVTNDKGHSMKHIEQYGWGKGHRHLYDTMRLPLCDFDALVRRGKNILILCQMQQITVANAGGDDFLCDVPKLAPQHGKTPSVWGMWTEWCDHVLKIGYSDIVASDKKATSSGERAIYVHGQAHFKAKSRTIPGRFPVVSFSDPTDDSIWEFLFNDAWKDIPVEDE